VKGAVIDALARGHGGRFDSDRSTEVLIKYLVLTIRKPSFDPAFRDAHFAFLDELRSRDLLEQAGAFTDRSGGAYVLLAETLEEARRLAERDPLHLHDCSTVIVHEWDSV
jgi:uncharacterized protein YciI